MTEEKNTFDFELAKRVMLDMAYLASTDPRYNKPKKWENLTDVEMHRTVDFIRECILTDEPGYIYAHSKLRIFFEDTVGMVIGPVKDMDCSLLPYNKLPEIASDWYYKFNESIQQNISLLFRLAVAKLEDEAVQKQ